MSLIRKIEELRKIEKQQKKKSEKRAAKESKKRRRHDADYTAAAAAVEDSSAKSVEPVAAIPEASASVWAEAPALETSRKDEFEDYFKDMF
jgi:hypothetical protein